MVLLKLRDHKKTSYARLFPRDSRIIEINSFKFAFFRGFTQTKGELCWDSNGYPHDISSFEQRFKPQGLSLSFVVFRRDSQWSKYPHDQIRYPLVNIQNNYGKSPSLIGKSTINGACLVAMLVITRGQISQIVNHNTRKSH